MRLVVFGSSIVSDWRNPIATSARPILSSLVAMGEDVLFLEERNNPWLVGLLKTRGLAPVRAFDAAYPDLQHRTYDPPRGRQRSIQFAQQVGTADAIVALPGTPEPVLAEIGTFHSPSVVRAVPFDAALTEADLRLGSLDQAGCDAVFGPAVPVQPPPSNGERSAAVVVAYDAAAGGAVAAAMADLRPLLVDQTDEGLQGWEYIPEVVLPEWFGRCRTAAVVGDWRDELAWARLLLPLASGCRVVAIGPGSERVAVEIPGVTAAGAVSQVAELIRACFPNDMQSLIPQRFDASRQADALLGVLSRVHDEKRRARR